MWQCFATRLMTDMLPLKEGKSLPFSPMSSLFRQPWSRGLWRGSKALSQGLQSGASRSLAAWGRALGARRSRQVLQVAQELVPEGAHLLRVHNGQLAQDACLVRLLLQQRAKRPGQYLHTVQAGDSPRCSLAKGHGT